MIVKDYYKILEVKSTATTGDIKKSYRKLAMKYHPDKNQGDALSSAVFSDVAEAYEILSDPVKRQQYNYNNYNIYNANYANYTPVGKESIKAAVDKLTKAVASSDIFRVNRDAVYFSIMQILSENNIQFLREDSDALFKKQVIEQLLVCSKPLTIAYIKKISDILLNIAASDLQMQNDIYTFIKKATRQNNWNTYKIVVAVATALALCLLIFLLSR